ncbi:MAG TPA: hypothetical protein DC049_08235 [Spirochaetia bacterium]|nr:hypothetical protein [Spirochaetia bacterium]
MNKKSDKAIKLTGKSILIACLLFIHAVPQYKITASSVVFTGTWQKPISLRHEVFSIAAANETKQINNGKPYEDTNFLNIIKILASPVLRLPGGDLMNNWNWLTGTVTGDSLGELNKAKYSEIQIPMSAENWYTIASAGNSKPLWGINITSTPVSHTEIFIQKLKSSRYQAEYFELGNELYYFKFWSNQIKNSADYCSLARAHAAVIKKYFPGTKLGVPFASEWMHKKFLETETDTNTDNYYLWMTGISGENFYDALVIHYYATPQYYGVTNFGDFTSEEITAKVWESCGVKRLNETLNVFHMAKPEKKIWITEWAFNPAQYFKKHPQETKYQVHQTMLSALYDARFMLNTAYYLPYVSIMTAWVLVNQPAVAVYKTDIGTTVKFELFRLLRTARDSCDTISHFIPDPDLQPGTGGSMEIFGFFRKNRLFSAVVLNISGLQISLEPDIFPGKIRSAQSIWADELLPDWGNSENPPHNEWAPKYICQKLTVSGKKIIIPKYSITLIHFGDKND